MKKRLIKILIIELLILSIFFLIVLNKEFNFINSIREAIEKFIFEEKSLPSIDYFEETIDRGKEHKVEDVIGNEKEQKDIVYSRIRDGLLEGKYIIKIEEKLLGDNRENFFDIVEEVLLDAPEIMYYTSGKYSKSTFYPSYNMPIEKKQFQQDAIKERRDYIIGEIIRDNMSQYEKVKAVHDYIVNNTQYDKRHLSGEEIPNESYTVYGVLFEGIAVCEGYAKTMKYLLDKIGIESKIVIGMANGENHAWNIVNIDGDYYHIDATWDDPVTEDGTNILIYDYFNLKDRDIKGTHNWNRDKYPICNSDKYNYYYYNGLVANEYKEFYNKVEAALINGKTQIALKVPYYEESTYNISDTINKIAANNSNIININKYGYSINSNQNIIRIYFYR